MCGVLIRPGGPQGLTLLVLTLVMPALAARVATERMNLDTRPTEIDLGPSDWPARLCK